MAKFIGSVDSFLLGEDFDLYARRLEHLFHLNSIKDTEKIGFLCSFGGADLYRVIVSLTAPKTENDYTYAELVSKLKSHLKPKRNIIAECYKFFKTNRVVGQKLADFVIELKQQAQHCEFGDFLEKALLIQFVCGVGDKDIQQRLLSEVNLNKFQKAIELANAVEITTTNVALIKEENENINVLKKKGNGMLRRGEQQSSAVNNNSNGTYNKQEVNWKKNFYKNVVCFNCGMKGHVQKFCKKKTGQPKIKSLEEESEEEEQLCNYINNIISLKIKPLKIKLVIENIEIEFEVDTGACVTVIHKRDFYKYFSKFKFSKSEFSIKLISGDRVETFGEFMVKVNFRRSNFNLKLIVLNTEMFFYPLLGRNWMDVIFSGWKMFFTEYEDCNVNLAVTDNEFKLNKMKFLEKYNAIFTKSNRSVIKTFRAEIVLKNDSYPIFCKANTVPYGLKDKVENELNRLCKEGVLIPVTRSNWASPLVVVNKGDGSIRLCVDCKRTVNKFVEMEHSAIPRIDDILASMAGWNVFTKLDLTGAYLQVAVSERSRELLTINTHVGLFQFTRLVFGFKTAPQIFCSIIDQILRNIENVQVYFDDIVIGGKSEDDCKINLLRVLDRLLEYNVKVNLEKCEFFKSEIDYLGYRINGIGIAPSPQKLDAVVNAPEPCNKTQLKSYLGMINYYNKCIPNLSVELHCLYELTKENVKWSWEQKHSESS